VEHIIMKMDDDGSGTISFQEFCRKARNFPLLLFPAFYMQDIMRKKCLGLGFWEKHTYRLRKSQKYGLDDDEQMLEVLKDVIFQRKGLKDQQKKGKGKKGKGKAAAKNVPNTEKEESALNSEGRNGQLPTAEDLMGEMDDMDEEVKRVVAKQLKRGGNRGSTTLEPIKSKHRKNSGSNKRGSADVSNQRKARRGSAEGGKQRKVESHNKGRKGPEGNKQVQVKSKSKKVHPGR
jgi:hypothetical protein